jgi:hypothetical protein
MLEHRQREVSMLRPVFQRLSFLIMATLFLSAAQTAALPPLEPDSRLEWPAIGVVNAFGTEGGSSCSGTLVAPDLVITAAHCTVKKAGLLDGLHFIAGRNGSRIMADSGSVEIMQYPAWGVAPDAMKLRFDLAVIRLSRQIPSDRVRPVDLFPKNAFLPETGALLGYQHSPDNELRGRFDCPLSAQSHVGTISSGCQVSSGNSGGAVLVETADGWQLAAVIVARREPEGTAVAVAINDWLRQLVSEAWARDAKRAARVENERP